MKTIVQFSLGLVAIIALAAWSLPKAGAGIKSWISSIGYEETMKQAETMSQPAQLPSPPRMTVNPIIGARRMDVQHIRSTAPNCAPHARYDSFEPRFSRYESTTPGCRAPREVAVITAIIRGPGRVVLIDLHSATPVRINPRFRMPDPLWQDKTPSPQLPPSYYRSES